MNKKIYVVGYSLDACLFAREKAKKSNKVIFIETDGLGYPYDIVGEYFKSSDINLIESLLDHPIECTTLKNDRYIHIPYDQLKMVNSKNGLVSFPLNKESFECGFEFNEVLNACSGLDVFIDKITTSTNYVNLFKSFFPKWLYECLLRYVSQNKWSGIKQSKLTRFALLKELDASYLTGSGTGTFLRPIMPYNEICEELLTHQNIHREKINPTQLGELIKKRFTDGDVYIMDNRIDMAVGYHYGMFDRVSLYNEITNDTNIEEILDIENGVILTPMKEYWCLSTKMGVTMKMYSKVIDTPNDYTLSVLSPTNSNAKMVADYTNLLTLYSNKILHLSQYVKPTII